MNDSVNSLHEVPVLETDSTLFFTCSKGNVAFSIERCKLFFLDQPHSEIELNYSAARTLERLLRNAGTVINREDLFEYAWAGRVVTQNSLNQVISQLREAIGDDADKEVIRTVSRIGYVFGRAYMTDFIDANKTDTSATPSPASIAVSPESPLPSPAPAPPAALTASPRGLQPLYWPFNVKVPKRTLGVSVIVGSLALWLFKVDFGLLLSTGFVSQAERYQTSNVIYIAASESGLKQMKINAKPLIQRLDALNTRQKTLVINDSFDYYDLYCLNVNEPPSFIFISKAAPIDSMTAAFKRCLL